MCRPRRKLQGEYPAEWWRKGKLRGLKDYWMASEPEPAGSLELEAGFGILSLSHFSSASWKPGATLRKRNPTCPLRSTQATSDSMSIDRGVSGKVNCNCGLASWGRAGSS